MLPIAFKVVWAVINAVPAAIGFMRDRMLMKSSYSQGAAEQRSLDYETELSRILDASDAGRVVVGLRDEQLDLNNRDNIK
jgi:hypothetical protein